MTEKNLFKIVPGSITIQNFIPNRIYRENILIYNSSPVPIVINLRSSDHSKLNVSESVIRIGGNQTKKVGIIIQDKVKYLNGKIPFKKNLFIFIKGDLFDEKYFIDLYYLNGVKNIVYAPENNVKFNNNNRYPLHHHRRQAGR